MKTGASQTYNSTNHKSTFSQFRTLHIHPKSKLSPIPSMGGYTLPHTTLSFILHILNSHHDGEPKNKLTELPLEGWW